MWIVVDRDKVREENWEETELIQSAIGNRVK